MFEYSIYVLTLNGCETFPVTAFGVVGLTIITAADAWLECGIRPEKCVPNL